MLDQYLYLLLTFFLTFAAYPLWINFVYKYHMGEKIREDGPQSHMSKVGTPTMGGLVFIVTVALVTFIFNRSRTQTLFPIFAASMAGLFGVLEDFSKVYKTSGLKGIFTPATLPKPIRILLFPVRLVVRVLRMPWEAFKEAARVVGSSSGRGLQTYQKFMIQATLAGFVSYWAYHKLGWDYIWMPLIGNLNIGIFYPVVIFFLFMAVLNFVAFTDGLDGLAGGLAAIAFSAYWVISSALGFHSLSALLATFVGALIPFLYFNVNPARIFMGDVGSHVLGASLAVVAVVLHREVALLFICAPFLVDGLSSPLQQLSVKYTGKRLLRMAPLHHHFELLGWPETKVTIRFWLFGILFSFIGIFIALL